MVGLSPAGMYLTHTHDHIDTYLHTHLHTYASSYRHMLTYTSARKHSHAIFDIHAGTAWVQISAWAAVLVYVVVSKPTQTRNKRVFIGAK